MAFDLDAALAGRAVRLRVDPMSAVNLLDPAAAPLHEAALGPAPPVEVASPAGPAVLDRAADLPLTVAGRSFPAVFYVAAWDLGGPDALIGAPTLHRRGIELAPDHSSLRS